MAFNSLHFWLVFPLVFLLYWLIPQRLQVLRKIWLIVASYLLYLNWKPVFALVLLFVTLVTYLGARAFESAKSRKAVLGWVFGILALAPLLTFKYYNFLNESLTSGLELLGMHFALPGLNWAVPVGLSFFTFQAAGYLFDVYRGQQEAEKNLLDYTLFVSFFPQIASGPISKARDLLPQIKHPSPFSRPQAVQGLKYLLWGMFLKVVVADRLGIFVDTVYAHYLHYNGTTLLLAAVLYAIQIYGDFAGYSLMAIGLASTLGFSLVQNFRRPYLAVSITDFWRRWHISLTRWLKDNIYIPLGGNRCSRLRCYWNILVTFLVSGIWHGAAWTFIIWGILHGLIQIVEKALGWTDYKGGNPLVRGLRILSTFLIVSLAWVFFRSPDMATAISYLGRIFTSVGIPAVAEMGGAVLLILLMSLSILIFKELREEFFPDRFRFLQTKPMRWCIYLALFCFICLFGVLDGGQFIYVSF